MKKGWRFLFCFLVVSTFLLVLGNSQIFASDSATVVATVQTELISISVNPSSIDYGLIPFNSDKDYPSALVVTNNGNVVTDIAIKGSDAIKQGDPSKI